MGLDLGQWLNILNAAFLVGSALVLFGVWRQKQESADKAAEVASAHLRELYGQQMKALEEVTRLRLDAIERSSTRTHEKVNELNRTGLAIQLRLAEDYVPQEEFQKLEERVQRLERRR